MRFRQLHVQTLQITSRFTHCNYNDLKNLQSVDNLRTVFLCLLIFSITSPKTALNTFGAKAPLAEKGVETEVCGLRCIEMC